MNYELVVQLLQAVVTNLPGAIKTAQELYALGEKFAATLKGSEPTPEEIAGLRKQIDTDVAYALLPLPTAQPGDPDYVKSES